MKILRAPKVAEKFDNSVPTIWRWSKDDSTFPKPVKISENVTGWIEEELDAWLAQRVAESRKLAA